MRVVYAHTDDRRTKADGAARREHDVCNNNRFVHNLFIDNEGEAVIQGGSCRSVTKRPCSSSGADAQRHDVASPRFDRSTDAQ